MENAEIFAVLADRSRRRVLELILQGERTVSDLVRATRLRQPLVSHHLKVLRGAGLAAQRKAGRFRFYHVASPEVLALLGKVDADAARLGAAAEAALERSPAPAAPRPRAGDGRAGAKAKK